MTRLPPYHASSFAKELEANRVQVTVKDSFRVTGYLDAKTGRLIRQETYSRDKAGWYMVFQSEFEYSPFGKAAFESGTLAVTRQFEFG